MRIDDRASEAVHQLEASECQINKIWPAKNYGDEMLRRLLRRSRNGSSPEHLAFVTVVIFQNGIRLRCPGLTIMNGGRPLQLAHRIPVLQPARPFGRISM